MVATGSPAERKSPKRRRPRCPCPLRCATGQPAVLASGGVRANSPAAQTARGPHPPEAVLLGTARGEGSQTTLRAIAALGPGQGAGTSTAQALGSDHDFAQRNSCSDPDPGTVGTARVHCQSMLIAVRYRRDDERLLSAISRPWSCLRQSRTFQAIDKKSSALESR